MCAYTVLVSFLAGVAAALASSRVDLNSELKGTGRGELPGRARLRDAMIVSQIAFALTLLTGTGLLVQNLVKLSSIDHGVDITNVYASRKASTSLCAGVVPLFSAAKVFMLEDLK